MNNKHIEGSWDGAKGKVKEEIGHAIGDNRTEAEGIVDQVKGKVEKGLGDLKDAVKKGVDTILNHGDKSARR